MNKKILLELIWWVITAIIVILIMFPIYNTVGDSYEFYLPNIFLITLFVTFTRYIFLLKYTLFANNKKIKVVLIFIPILFFFYAMNSLFNFQDYIDKDEHIQMLSHLSPDKAIEISKYIKYQFLFFGTGGMLVIFLFPIRMIISVWRSINTNRV
jgi:heme/copper-type cytochrome/quinol oxidase subunit 2